MLYKVMKLRDPFLVHRTSGFTGDMTDDSEELCVGSGSSDVGKTFSVSRDRARTRHGWVTNVCGLLKQWMMPFLEVTADG